MKVLITGVSGQLGSQLQKSALKEYEIIPLKKNQFDLQNKEYCKKVILELRPDWIINTAAFTAVDKAEIEVSKAFEINAFGVENLAKTCSIYGGRLLQISTDFVFDGCKKIPYLPNDKSNPLNIYGASKLKGEYLSLKYPGTLVLRTSWLYGPSGDNFLLKMLNLHENAIKESKLLKVVNDQRGCPTDTIQLAEICWKLIKKGINSNSKNKLFHWSNKCIITWYDFALAIGKYAEEYGLIKKAANIKPVPSSDYETLAKRPNFSALDCHNTSRFLEIDQIEWSEALKLTLKKIKPRSGTI